MLQKMAIAWGMQIMVNKSEIAFALAILLPNEWYCTHYRFITIYIRFFVA